MFGYITTPQGDPIDTLHVGGSSEDLTAALKKAIETLGTREGKTLVEPRPQNPPPKAEPDALLLHLTARLVAGSNGSEFRHDLTDSQRDSRSGEEEKTQKPDGSWPMTSRPVLDKPDGGPAKDLVPITFAASAWATMGLVRSVPQRLVKRF